jgi:N-acetylneuraminic acid mutarotase
MPYAARELTASLLPNGFIHIAGGTDGSSYKNFSYWYDPYNNTWTAKNNLPVTWVDGRVGNLPDGRIIIAGGSVNNDNGARVTTTYIYDPDTDTYELTSPLLFGVGNHVSTTMADGRTISVGGVLPGNLTSSLYTQIFDPSTMSWSLGADAPFAHNDYAGIAATPCGTVYLWGGGTGPSVFTGIKRVDAYDPSTDTWSTIPDLPFFAQCGAYGRFYDGQYIWASGNDNTSLTPKTYLSTDPVGD